ncbi:MAG: efflux RND transporter periplasmic adaptor subunit [Bacteroidota bacterium]
MKRILITAVLSVVLGLGVGWLVFYPSSTSETPQRKIKFYRDPMNPQITSATPKKSSDGMDFVPVYEEATGGTKKIAYYKDPMHPWFTSPTPGTSPDCGMDMVPVYEGESDTKGIKIDPVVVQNIGVKIEPVVRKKLNKVIRTTGKVDFDETKVYSVNTKIMGWVEKLFVDYTGKVVRKGDPLMELYSPELVSTQEEYLQAIRYKNQLTENSTDVARKGADQLIESAKRRLLYWDISEREINDLETRGIPRKTLTIFSPADGIVMEKMIFKGKNVMPGMDLYKIADLSTVWVQADIYQYELPWVNVGDKADIELSYLQGKTFSGRITYIYPMLNMETKTIKVRIEVHNTARIEFKPEMYANVKITSPISVNAVVVPEQAVIHSGERNIAVISLGGGYFDPREIKLGVSSEGEVQVLDGIHEGENIVVSSQFLIDSESNLKAAINQMAGHAGMDMSKPMDEQKSAEEQSHQPSQTNHTGHDMSSMQSSSTVASSPKKQSQKKQKEKSVKEHGMQDMNMEGMEDSSTEKSALNITNKKILDPVCGMEAVVDDDHAYVYKGRKYYFCSEEDREKFKQDPDKYATHPHQ